MRITSTSAPTQVTAVSTPTPTTRASAPSFSVLNDFRYLTDTDKSMLRYATGEVVEPGIIDRRGSASAFTQQLALDRRTGQLQPHQDVTSVYLRNASARLEEWGADKPGFTNPYSGVVYDRALAWLDANGLSRADIRM